MAKKKSVTAPADFDADALQTPGVRRPISQAEIAATLGDLGRALFGQGQTVVVTFLPERAKKKVGKAKKAKK